jgi:hypothetical protein
VSAVRRQRRQREREHRKAAIRAARAPGCTCAVEVAFATPDHAFHGTELAHLAVSVRHDD